MGLNLQRHGLIFDDVRAIAIAPDGTVWFGTDYGIARYTPPRQVCGRGAPGVPFGGD